MPCQEHQAREDCYVADGGCSLGKRPVPSKWSWVSKASDLSGSRCEFGSGKGTSKRLPLPKKPASVAGNWRGGLTGRFAANFTVSATWGKQKASSTLSKRWETVESYVYCGAPPKLLSLEGAAPSALTWATKPSFDGRVVKAGTIQSRGNGQCRWLKAQPLAGGVFLQMGYRFVCENRTNGYVEFYVQFYDALNQRTCINGASRTSSFVVFPKWGPGTLKLSAEVVTWVSGTDGQLSEWKMEIPLRGTSDPCADW